MGRIQMRETNYLHTATSSLRRRPVHAEVHDPTPKSALPELEVVLRNHAEAIAAIDLCMVATVRSECLFAFVVIGQDGGIALVCGNRHPTAEWLAQLRVKAFPWETAPAYLGARQDGPYGQIFKRRVRAMGDPRANNITAIALAEPLYGTADRNAAARLPGSRPHLRRGASAAGPAAYSYMQIKPVIGFMQYAIAKVLIFVLALAASSMMRFQSVRGIIRATCRTQQISSNAQTWLAPPRGEHVNGFHWRSPTAYRAGMPSHTKMLHRV